MVQHLLHIQNLVTPEIWYNTRRFRRLVSPLGASGSGFGIFQPPPLEGTRRLKGPGAGTSRARPPWGTIAKTWNLKPNSLQTYPPENRFV